MIPGQIPPPAPSVPSLGRQPALDGIRGIAVLVVLAHNHGCKWLGGGFLGVDVFFALSGFLITTLLLEDHARHGSISLPAFFARRFLRLYPALVVLVLFALLSSFAWSTNVPAWWRSTVVVSVLTYWSNWLHLSDLQAWFGGISHTWSLAIEMQYYVLWAAIMATVTRGRGADLRTLALIAAGIAVTSAVWRDILWSLNEGYPRLYAGSDTRLDAVFLGSLAALLRLRHLTVAPFATLANLSRRHLWLAELFCLGAVLGSFRNFDQDEPSAYFAGIPAVALATSALILSSLLRRESLAARLFATPVLAWFGRISYSLYLWHVPVGKVLPVEFLLSRGVPPFAAYTIRAAVSITVAAGSYYGIERPFLRLKVRFAR